jgi:transposase
VFGAAMQSSKPIIFPPIPGETVKSARSVFGRSNFYLAIGDQADKLFDGIALIDPSGSFRKPPRTLAMLYLITIFQFVETLPDHQAADALRGRTDWKYALHLPLNHPGLPPESFCDFRRWLKAEAGGQRDLQTLLLHLSEITKFTARQPTSLDSKLVITFVCQISRLANVWEALHQAMEALASRRPEWLLATSQPHWILRYGSQRRHLDLTGETGEGYALSQAIGTDGYYLLEAISRAGDPGLANLEEVRKLRELWCEQFEYVAGKILWRGEACAGCSVPGLSPDSFVGADQGKQEVE